MLFSFFCLAILFMLNLGLKIISRVFPLCLSLKMRPLRQKTHGGLRVSHQPWYHGTCAAAPHLKNTMGARARLGKAQKLLSNT